MGNKLTIRNAGLLFFKIGLFLLPYDSIRYLMPSSYRPVSIYFFLAYLCFYIIRKSFKISVDKATRNLVTFIIYALGISLITSFYFVSSLNYYKDFAITLVMGVIIFISCNFAFREISHNISTKEFINKILHFLGISYMFPLLVGILELLSMYGLLPISVKEFSNMMFGGWQTGRLSITTYEASWASMHMLFAIFIYLYLIKNLRTNKLFNYISLMLAMTLFVFTFSTQGILVFVFGLVIFMLLKQINKRNLFELFKNLCIGGAIVVIILFLFYRILLLMPDTYFASRIINFTSFQSLIYKDGSSFVRIGYLLVHTIIFKDNFLLGIGGGNFNFLFADYVINYFPVAASLPEVASHIANSNCNTSVSIYFRILSELGIVGCSIFCNFFFGVMKKLRNIDKHDNFILLWIAMTLAMPIQFGSWAYVPFWLIIAFINNLHKRSEII